MKYFRYFVTFCLCIFFCVATTYAATPTVAVQTTSSTEIIYLEDGNYLEITTTVYSNSRARITDASKQYLCKNLLGEQLFSYTLLGRFEYDGTTSKSTGVTSTYAIYNSDWNFGSSRESYSGNTVYGSATFGGPQIKTVGGSISCDKNGNIT